MATSDNNHGIWQVLVNGMERAQMKAVIVADNEDNFFSTNVKRLRELIHAEWNTSLEPDSLRILFAGKQLEDHLPDGSIATLEDYDLYNGALLQIVLRLKGGMYSRCRNPSPPIVDKMHDISDSSLSFTEDKPDCITGDSYSDDPPRVIMSCGHAVDASNLSRWCRIQLKERKYEFRCPAIVPLNKTCGAIWKYSEIRRVAKLTEKERKYFECLMSENAALRISEIKECPGCGSSVERCDVTNIQVHCDICSKTKGKRFEFCWLCGKEWSGQNSSSSVKCNNPACEHPSISAIRNAPMITLNKQEVSSCRACPTCGLLIEHSQEGCKFVICSRCSRQFCFLCLLPEKECLKTANSSWYGLCKLGVAPKQTVIPIWSQNPLKA